MARIRSIKPEFWTDEAVLEISDGAKLVMLGLISHADDDGRMLGAVTTVKARVLPASAASLEDIAQWLQELHEHGLIVRYRVGCKAYVYVSGWRKHQKIRSPYPSALPEPPSPQNVNPLLQNVTTGSQNAEATAQNPEPVTQNGAWSGSGSGSGNGIKHIRRPKADGQSPKKSKTAWSEDETAVFDHWVATFDKSAAVHKSNKRRSRIRELLKRLGLKETKRLITLLRESEFHVTGGYVWFRNRPLSCPDAAEAFLAQNDTPTQGQTATEKLEAFKAARAAGHAS